MTATLSNLTATWNNGGTTFTAIKMNVTNTASAAGSKLLDLQVGGSPKFNVNPDGDTFANGTNSAGSLPGGLYWDSDQSLIARRPAFFGSHGEFGKLHQNPTDPTQDTFINRTTALVANHVLTGSQLFASGIAGYFGVNVTSNANVNGVLGHDIYVSINSDNVGNFAAGVYCASLAATNFTQAVTTAFSLGGMYVQILDYANPPIECHTSYTDYIGIDLSIGHRGLGTATNVVGLRSTVSNGYGPTPGTAGTCTNLIGIDVRTDPIGDNVTNAWGLRIQDYSGIGSSQSYNIKSEGAASLNLFEGAVKILTTTVASLPAASIGAGYRAFVTDANATTFGSTVAGGGSNNVPVYSDGSNWKIG